MTFSAYHLLSFLIRTPSPGLVIVWEVGPLYLVTGGVNVPGKALRWSLDRQGGQAGGRFELLGTLNVPSLQTDIVTQSLSRVLLWEHFSQGNRSFPPSIQFCGGYTLPDPSPTFLLSSRR